MDLRIRILSYTSRTLQLQAKKKVFFIFYLPRCTATLVMPATSGWPHHFSGCFWPHLQFCNDSEWWPGRQFSTTRVVDIADSFFLGNQFAFCHAWSDISCVFLQLGGPKFLCLRVLLLHLSVAVLVPSSHTHYFLRATCSHDSWARRPPCTQQVEACMDLPYHF